MEELLKQIHRTILIKSFFSLKSMLSSRAVPNRKCEVSKLHLIEALRIKYVTKSSGSERKVRSQQASLYGSTEDNYITLRNKKTGERHKDHVHEK